MSSFVLQVVVWTAHMCWLSPNHKMLYRYLEHHHTSSWAKLYHPHKPHQHKPCHQYSYHWYCTSVTATCRAIRWWLCACTFNKRTTLHCMMQISIAHDTSPVQCTCQKHAVLIVVKYVTITCPIDVPIEFKTPL